MSTLLRPKTPCRLIKPSGGYENIVTAMDVYSRYLFGYPTSNSDAKTVAKVSINLMTKHAYLPTALISDKGTAFMSYVIKEVAAVFGITLKNATTKHAQPIGLPERSHASIQEALKIETGKRRSLWHKYVNLAVLNYNTSYQTSIGCEPSQNFRGRIPYNILDLKMRIRPQQQPTPTGKWPKIFYTKQKLSIKLLAEIPCKLTSNIKLITIKRLTLQRSKKQNMYTSNNQKRIIKEVKFHLQNFGGLAPTILKRCFLTTNICTQNWHQQDASASTYANASVHNPRTPS